MKRIFFVLVLMMSVLVISAQTSKTTSTTTKSARTTVKVADLQKPITDNIAKDYAGFTIKDASSTTTNNVVTYHVVVVKGSDTETLVYDKDGMFVKKLPKATAKHHTTKKK
jgi:ABC-type Fe3+-hydroxamate transport system substrate-binding protein